MKKILSLLYIAVAMLSASCSSNENVNTPYLETYVNGLMEQYPNFESNDLARSAVKDSVLAHAASSIGKPCKDIEGLEFSFEKIVDGEKGKCAVFLCDKYTMIDAPAKSEDKYIGANLQLVAFGLISDEVAAKLDGNVKYNLSGVLHAVDEKDYLYASPASKSPFFFGVYILNNLQVTE